MQQRDKGSLPTRTGYVVCLTVLFISSLFLFYRQMIQFGGLYPSDMHYYVKEALSGNGDRLLTISYALIYKMTGSIYALAAFQAAIIIGIVLSSEVLMRTLIGIDGLETPAYMTQAAALILVFSGSIYVPHFHHYFYNHCWNDFAWHSPTQQLMIFLAMMSLLYFTKLCSEYRSGISIKNWIGLMVFTALSCWAKPSYMMAFGPAVVVAFLLELKTEEGITVGMKLKKLIVIGSALIPGGLVVIFYAFWYGGAVGDSKVHFGTKNFAANSEHLLWQILCGLALPIIVLLFNSEYFKKLEYKIGALIFVFGLAEYAFIYETGRNANYGNFGWGKQFGCFYIMALSLVILIENLKNPEFMRDKPKLRKWYFIICIGIIIAMVLSRLYFYQALLKGRNYMK